MRISGLIPATVTPFRANGSIDYDDLTTHLKTVVESTDEIFGIAVNGHAGEITTLTTEERYQIVAAARKVVPPHLRLFAGIEGLSANALVRDGLNAKAAGADGLLVLPPFDNRLRRRLAQNADVVCSVFVQLDREVALPMIVFQYPQSSGCEYSLAALERICELRNVVAIKMASGEVGRYAYFYDRLKDKVAVLAANDTPRLLAMLLHGAAGALIGISVIGTATWAELVREATTGNAQRAKEIWHTFGLRLTKAIFDNDEHTNDIDPFGCTKEALALLGQIKPSSVFVRPPAVNPDDARKAEIRRLMELAGLLTPKVKGAPHAAAEPLVAVP